MVPGPPTSLQLVGATALVISLMSWSSIVCAWPRERVLARGVVEFWAVQPGLSRSESGLLLPEFTGTPFCRPLRGWNGCVATICTIGRLLRFRTFHRLHTCA